MHWSLGEALGGLAHHQPPPAQACALAPGDVLEGGYEVVELLGEGAFGRVYRARDAPLGREVAIKVLTASGGSRERRFLREGRIAAALDHPAIGRVFSTGRHGENLYLVYELLEGARDLGVAATHWTREQRLEAALTVAEGVAFAHQHGVVHRDLKPENVIVDNAGRCRVIDFGLARDATSERLTLDGALVGSPLFMPPEAFFGQEQDAASDVWSLGVILYWLLTDTHPFVADGLIELARRVDQGPSQPPTALDSTIDPAVSAVCMRALARRPRRRYRDGGEFADALRAALEGPATPGSSLRTLGWLAAASAISVAALVAVWRAKQPDLQAAPAPSEAATPNTQGQPQQAEALQRALEELDRGDTRAAVATLKGAVREVGDDKQQAQALWRSALATLAASELNQLEPRLAALDVLARVPGAAQAGADGAGAELAELGVRLTESLLEPTKNQGRDDPQATRERLARGLSVLQRLARCGLRTQGWEHGASMFSVLSQGWQVGMIDEAIYWDYLLAGAKLDLRFSSSYLALGRTRRKQASPWPGTRDPWKRYLTLRSTLESSLDPGSTLEVLLLALEHPAAFAGQPWELGPNQWAGASTLIAVHLPPPRAHALLERAEALAPEDPGLHRALAHSCARQSLWPAALDYSRRGLKILANAPSEYHRALGDRTGLLRTQLEVLIVTGDRPAARETVKQLIEQNPPAGESFLRKHPWLGE